jgi:hypothetical protein
MYEKPYNSPYLKYKSQDEMPDMYQQMAQEKPQMESFSPTMSVPQSAPIQVKPQAGIDAGQTAQAGMTGASVGGVPGAAVAVGGSLLSQYIAQKAADERAKREGIGQAYAKQASDEQNIINSIMATNARALR